MEKCDQSEKQREMMTKWKNRHGLLKTVTVAPIKQEDGMLAPFDPLIENWDPTMFSEPQPIAVQPAQPAETKVQPFHEAIEEDDNDSSEDENASSSEEEEYCDDADNGAEPLPKRRQLHRGWNNGMAQLGHPPIAQMYGQTGSGYKPLYSNVPSGGQQGYPTGPFANGHPPSYISNFQSPPVRTRSMAAQGSSDLPERPRLPPRKTSKRSAATVGVKKRSRSRKTS
jgi:hypothetical protein